MNDFLEQRIKAKEAALVRLSRQIQEMRKTRAEIAAEIRAYRDVLSHVSDPGAEFPPANDEEETKSASSRISDNWRDIMIEIAKFYPKAVSIENIRHIIRILDKEVSDLTLRSQLSLYKSRGWLDNVGLGKYKITSKGATAVGYELPYEED